MLHSTGWVPHGFSRGGREFRAEFVFPTSKEMGHPWGGKPQIQSGRYASVVLHERKPSPDP